VGRVVYTTAANGFLHKHRLFYLDDGDSNTSTTPENGIYLIAMQLRMANLETSDPFYLLWSMPGVPTSTLNSIARPWVESHVDELIWDGLASDFDGDGDTDGSDFLSWQIGFGTASGAQKFDGDYDTDGAVDGVDLLGWQGEFGTSVSGVAPHHSVPEPASMALVLALMIAGSIRPSRNR
jgi:hypothetical protein